MVLLGMAIMFCFIVLRTVVKCFKTGSGNLFRGTKTIKLACLRFLDTE